MMSTVILMLAPALLVIALAQSLGYFAPAEESSFTLAHYAQLLSDREFRASLALTMIIATLATAISAAVGLVIALALRELAARRRWLNFLLQIPQAVPHLAMAVALINVIAPSWLVARMAFAAGLIHAPSNPIGPFLPVPISVPWDQPRRIDRYRKELLL